MTRVPNRRGGRLARIAGATLALTLAVYGLALAHAVVYPKASTLGAYERYVIRVPNERTVPTTRVEIGFPADVRVSAFSDVPGWQLEVVRDSAKRIVGAVWRGALPPERFAEFPFVAANPKEGTSIVWPVVQIYADGERAEWTGAAGSKQPASTTTLAAPVVASSGPAASSVPSGRGSAVSYAALGLAVVSLGLSLRKRS